MKKSAQMIAVFVGLSLVLSGCGQLTNHSGKSVKGDTNTVSPTTGGSATHQRTGNRTTPSSSGGGSQATSDQPGSGGTQGGSAPGKTSPSGKSSGSTPVKVTTPTAFPGLHTGPLTAVWFAPPVGTVSPNTGQAGTANATSPSAPANASGGQIGYVTDAHHVYRTADGGKTWLPVAAISGAIVGVTSDEAQSGRGLTVAWTSSELWLSTDGIHFTQAKVQLPAAGLTQVSVAGGVVWLLDGTTLYRYANDTLQTVSSSTVGNVSAITAVDANTCYLVAASTAVYKTTDGGGTWQQLFWPPLNAQLPWQTQIEVSGSHIAVLYAGGDSGVGQSAYIAVESSDGGTTWSPLFDNPHFAGDYGHPTPLVQQDLGSTALLFTLLPTGDAVFVGSGTIAPKWTVVSPQGTVRNTFSMTAGGRVVWPDLATATAVAPGGEQVVLVGGMGSHGVIDMSPTGGSTWDTLS